MYSVLGWVKVASGEEDPAEARKQTAKKVGLLGAGAVAGGVLGRKLLRHKLETNDAALAGVALAKRKKFKAKIGWGIQNPFVRKAKFGSKPL